LCLLYVWRYQRADVPRTRTVVIVAALSWITIFVLLFPVHLVGRSLEPGLNSRWALFPSLLTALVLGIGLPRLLRSAYLGNLMMVVLILVGLVTQVGINQEYIDDWELRRDLWWQIRWRAPELEAGTMLTVIIAPEDLAFGRTMTDYEAMAHSNLFYRRDEYPAVVAGTPFFIYRILAGGLPTRGLWSERVFQNWQFDFDEMVVFAYDGGCLTTADPSARTQISGLTDFANLAALHHPEQITATPLEALPPAVYEDIIGPEPARGWCYHYQQIQWAAEQGQLAEAARLAREAIDQNSFFVTQNFAELIPLIMVFNQVGDFESARYLIMFIATSDARSQQILCERLGALPESDEIAEQMHLIPGC
jgi:hypothetical protein